MEAIRLTFSVVEGKPELDRSDKVTMRVRRQRHAQAIARESGVWLETRDKDGTALYATVLDSMILSPMIEIRTGVGDPGLTAVKSAARQMMHVVVPDQREAASFHILRREKRDAKPEEILMGNF